MGTPFIGEIRMFGGNFAPAGWAACDGQIIPISQNDTLFNLIGTTYGGDGQETFALPDLRGRLPIHMGTGPGLSTYVIGQSAGVEEVTLTTNQIPNHSHPMVGSSDTATSNSPIGSVVAQPTTFDFYRSSAPSVAMYANSIGPVGGSQPHTNLMPFTCVTFIISLFGIYPTPT